MTPPTPKEPEVIAWLRQRAEARLSVAVTASEVAEVLSAYDHAVQSTKDRESAIATHERMLTALLDTNAVADQFANVLSPCWFEFAERIESLRDQMEVERTLKDAAVRELEETRKREALSDAIVDECDSDITDLVQERARLRTRLAELERDAKRLDWLHAKGENWIARDSTTDRGFRVHQSRREGATNIREAIDAAMTTTTGEG